MNDTNQSERSDSYLPETSDGQSKVTVLLASYDRLDLLKKSVQSALAQDHSDFEVLIVDDGSSEETRAWLTGSQKRHVCLRVIFQEHEGVGAARATGVTEASGEFVCILDSDDTLMPHALERLSGELENHPEIAICYCNISEQRPNGVTAEQRYPNFETARGMLWATLCRPRVPFKHSGTMFRRSIAIALGSYDRSLPCKVDIDFYLKFLSAGYKPQLVPETLVGFRMHKHSVSHNRALGLHIWRQLIDCYGPSNPLIRLGIKLFRTAAETFKFLYVEVTG